MLLHSNAWSPERARGDACSMVQKTGISKWHGFFSTATEHGKPPLKELWHAARKEQETVLNSVFLCLEFLFKLSQAFKLILDGHVGASWSV